MLLMGLVFIQLAWSLFMHGPQLTMTLLLIFSSAKLGTILLTRFGFFLDLL
jgi:hypothetical protein